MISLFLSFLIVILLPRNSKVIKKYSLNLVCILNIFSLNLYWINKDYLFNFSSININNSLSILKINLWGPFIIVFDNISILFIILTNLLILICIIVSWDYINILIKEFYLFLIVLLLFLNILFMNLDFLIFYILFEFSLIPTFLIILIWGKRVQKEKASFYFFFLLIFWFNIYAPICVINFYSSRVYFLFIFTILKYWIPKYNYYGFNFRVFY